jgi:hypothetical protein
MAVKKRNKTEHIDERRKARDRLKNDLFLYLPDKFTKVDAVKLIKTIPLLIERNLEYKQSHRSIRSHQSIGYSIFDYDRLHKLLQSLVREDKLDCNKVGRIFIYYKRLKEL